MAKLSPEQEAQLQELMALQEAEEEPEDFDLIIEVDGKRVTMPYSRAKKWLSRQGIDLDEELGIEGEEGEGEGEEEGEEGEEGELAGEIEGKVPAKRPAKKAPAKLAAVEGEPLKTSGTSGRSYWKKSG